MKIQCTKVPVVTDKRNVHENQAKLILSIIIVVSSIYKITFATRKSKASHVSINVPVFPIVPKVKLVKIGILLEIKHI